MLKHVLGGGISVAIRETWMGGTTLHRLKHGCLRPALASSDKQDQQSLSQASTSVVICAAPVGRPSVRLCALLCHAATCPIA